MFQDATQTFDLFGDVAPSEPAKKPRAAAVAHYSIDMKAKAPITAKERAMLAKDAANVAAAAQRKCLTLDRYEERAESLAAKQHFELGCWLFHYQKSFGKSGCFHARVQCLLRLFLSGITNPGYDFFTVFDFGERQFDTTLEMGDSKHVLAELRKALVLDKTGNLRAAFEYHGWALS